MKRKDIVALSSAAAQRAKANKVGAIGATKKQLEKLKEHQKEKAARSAVEGRGAIAS
jgi:hypothetical protein